jgi:hypothetical protein
MGGNKKLTKPEAAPKIFKKGVAGQTSEIVPQKRVRS